MIFSLFIVWLVLVLFLLSWQRAWFFCFGKLWKPQRGWEFGPSAHPSGFFLGVLGLWWYGVDFCLYAFGIDAERCAEVVMEL